MSYGNLRYPVVLVHGMFGWGTSKKVYKTLPYWGATTGDLVGWLNDCGYKCFAATVGPLSSAWDQACELYAQLKGTRVDYGEAHSKKFNHKRFGRKYSETLAGEWNAHNKIHIIGHSFGGNCVRMLAHLLANGAPEEVEASGDDVSGLFKGGNSDLLCSITSLCASLNGTNAYETAARFKILPVLTATAFSCAAIIGQTSLNGELVDIQLEQFGGNGLPGEYEGERGLKPYVEFLKNPDNVKFDMSPEGTKIMNDRINISANNYYFSYPFNVVEKDKKTGRKVPVGVNFKFLTFTSSLMLLNSKLSKTEAENNDGLVELSAASYPFKEPHIECDGNNIAKGVWNVMPVTHGDHGSPIGLCGDRRQTRSFYLKHFNILETVEKEYIKD